MEQKSVLRAFPPDQPGVEDSVESMARRRGAKSPALVDEFTHGPGSFDWFVCERA
jgi:hypothetical protein